MYSLLIVMCHKIVVSTDHPVTNVTVKKLAGNGFELCSYHVVPGCKHNQLTCGILTLPC
jgi:hypothetical protein